MLMVSLLLNDTPICIQCIISCMNKQMFVDAPPSVCLSLSLFYIYIYIERERELIVCVYIYIYIYIYCPAREGRRGRRIGGTRCSRWRGAWVANNNDNNNTKKNISNNNSSNHSNNSSNNNNNNINNDLASQGFPANFSELNPPSYLYTA